MLPAKPHTVAEGLLQGNSLNYGATCERWHDNDPNKWCYVGYDTMCPDRTKRTETWGYQDGRADPEQRIQYKSYVACSKEEQEGLVPSSQTRCKNVSVVLDLLLIFSVILYLPKVVILFKFLSNHCGDEFDAEKQFAVIFSSDEESGEEWLPQKAEKTL